MTSVLLAKPSVLQPYYNYFTYYLYPGASSGRNVLVPAPLSDIPLLIRGGSIIPTRERPRRSSTLMKRDPFTLHVALDKTGHARGELYLDDGETYEHQKGHFIWREFVAYNPNKKTKSLCLKSTNLASASDQKAVHGGEFVAYDSKNIFAKSMASVRIERVVILGLNQEPGAVKTDGGDGLLWAYDQGVATGSGKKEGVASVLTIKDPGLFIANDWTINIVE